MRNKTDRNDAWYSVNPPHRLVQPHAHHEPAQVAACAPLASRKAILTKRVDRENELRGLLRVFGIRLAITTEGKKWR